MNTRISKTRTATTQLLGWLKPRLTRQRILILAIAALCLLLAVLQGPHFFFGDEHDNLLGGQFIAHGGVLYRDYFSHHMPLAYFVAAPFMAVFGMHLVLVKMAFGLATTAWLLIISRHIYQRLGVAAWVTFVGLLTISQSSAYANMLLAETLTGYAILHLFVLFFFRKNSPFGWRHVMTYSLLSAVPVLSSASSVWLSVLGYIMMLVHGWEWMKPQKSLAWLRRIGASAAIVAAPYLLLLTYLVATHSLGEFKFQAFTFNIRYYSQFTDAVSPDGSLYSLLNQLGGGWAGFEKVLLSPSIGLPLLATLFAIGLLLAVATWFKPKQYATGIIAGLLVAFSAARVAFPNVLQNGAPPAASDTRLGTTLALLGLGIMTLTLFLYRATRHARSARQRSDLERMAMPCISVVLLIVGLLSIGHIFNDAQEYHMRINIVSVIPPNQTRITAEVINAVNGNGGTYWVGPIDFYSQTQITSANASKYRFFLPWSGACPSCTAELVNDLKQHEPNVIYFDRDVAIWNLTAQEYAKPVDAYITTHYFTVKDPRLKRFYFNPKDEQHIKNVLQQLGYTL